MKTPHPPRQSATSLPRAPRDDAHARSTKYLVMMAVRLLCFALMALVTPYGWYTWVFAAGAVFLPYIAVVIANVGEDVQDTAVSPERMLPTAPPETPAEPAGDTAPPVIRITESPRLEPRDDDGTARP